MNILSLPELFYLTSTNLNDEEKVFLTSSSKITYNFKSLLILDSEYYLHEINNKWRIKNVIIKKYFPQNKIKELIENSIPESIIVNSRYVKFVSNNINIKLFHSKKIIKKIVSYGNNYMAMKIMLNNNESIKNINEQFIESSKCDYLDMIKLFIELGADIHAKDNEAIIIASHNGHLSVVKLLIDSGADIHAQNDGAIIVASRLGHLFVVKLLINSGANVHAQDNGAIIWASWGGYLSVVELLIESGANIHAQENRAIIMASWNGRLRVIKLLIYYGADIHARNNEALKVAVRNKCSKIVKLLKKN